MRRNVRRLNREVGHITSELSAAAPTPAQSAAQSAMMPTEMMPVLKRDGAGGGAEGKPQDPSFTSPQPESKNGKRPLKSRKAANLAGNYISISSIVHIY